MKPHFQSIDILPDDPILGLPKLYNQDKRSHKVNLGIGIYLTEKGDSYLFKSVKEAEKRLIAKQAPKDYLPIDGDPFFVKKMIELNLGENTDPEKVFGAQTIGGTGSLKLAADILSSFYSHEIAISDPSWVNHGALFQRAGFKVHLYPYYDAREHKVLFEQAIDALKKLPQGCIILFQPSCHNPTGAEFSKDEWKILLKLVQEREFLPLFDNAYQGFGRSLEEDVYPIQLSYENGVEMVIAMGCSKNFGLYGERLGALIFSLSEGKQRVALMSQMRKTIRSQYSSPPLHGAKIVGEIFQSLELTRLWKEELLEMRVRLTQLRTLFAKQMITKTANPLYHSLEKEKGFFSLLGIPEEQVTYLREEKGIYMLNNSRINISGLNAANLDYVIDSL